MSDEYTIAIHLHDIGFVHPVDLNARRARVRIDAGHGSRSVA